MTKYGWLNASDADNRLLGSKTSIDRNREMASDGAAVKISSNGMGGQSSHRSPRVGNGSALWSGQLVSVGVPKTVKMVSS